MTATLSQHEAARVHALARYQLLDQLPDAAFARLATLAARQFRAPIALVNFLTEDAALTRACVGIDLTRTDRHLSFCARTILQDTPLVLPDLESDPAYDGHPLVVPNGPFRFYAGAPLITPDGQRIGTLCVLDYQPHHDVTPEDREALVSLAGLVMDELELRLGREELQRELDANASLLRQLKESQQMSGALLGVGALLDLELPLHEVAEQAIALIARAANADWGTLVSLTGDSLAPVANWTRTAPQQPEADLPWRLTPGHGVVWAVARQGMNRYVTDYARQPDADPTLVARGLRSVAWLPLGRHDEQGYVLIFGRLSDAGWSVQDQDLFAAVARTVRATLERRTKLLVSERAALTDPLTGLGNRRAFETRLAAQEHTAGWCTALIDLDEFKAVNDRLGHAGGDALLRLFGAALCAQLPVGATAYRIGGDEFALIGPSGGATEPSWMWAAHAQAVAAVQAGGFERMNASFGWAVPEGPQEDASAVLDRADRRLYTDKADHQRAQGQPVLTRASRAGLNAPGAFQEGLPDSWAGVMQVGPLTLHLGPQRAEVGGQPLLLPPRPYALLAVLAARAGQLVPHQELIERAWGGQQKRTSMEPQLVLLRRELARLTPDVTVRNFRGQGFVLQLGSTASGSEQRGHPASGRR